MIFDCESRDARVLGGLGQRHPQHIERSLARTQHPEEVSAPALHHRAIEGDDEYQSGAHPMRDEYGEKRDDAKCHESRKQPHNPVKDSFHVSGISMFKYPNTSASAYPSGYSIKCAGSAPRTDWKSACDVLTVMAEPIRRR